MAMAGSASGDHIVGLDKVNSQSSVVVSGTLSFGSIDSFCALIAGEIVRLKTYNQPVVVVTQSRHLDDWKGFGSR